MPLPVTLSDPSSPSRALLARLLPPLGYLTPLSSLLHATRPNLRSLPADTEKIQSQIDTGE